VTLSRTDLTLQISNALSDNMLVDLHMTTANCKRSPLSSLTTDNTGMTIFYLCFLCAELPSQMSE
jgi:hypothetical protein